MHTSQTPPNLPLSIRVQTDDFDPHREYQWLSQAAGTQAGALVTFIGRVRDFADPTGHTDFYLEHYPGMTEKVLHRIADTAAARWPLLAITLVHRTGALAPGAQIVLVGVATAHRQHAFEACAFLMDQLKTQAPFWKREGSRWVDAKDSDAAAAAAWETE